MAMTIKGAPIYPLTARTIAIQLDYEQATDAINGLLEALRRIQRGGRVTITGYVPEGRVVITTRRPVEDAVTPGDPL